LLQQNYSPDFGLITADEIQLLTGCAIERIKSVNKNKNIILLPQ